jgi:hypothetical protein
MKKIIRQYYLFTFVGFFVVFSLQSLVVKSPNSFLENLLIAGAGALVLSLTIGTIYYFLDTKWGPAKREKRFSKPPFTELIDAGFQRENDCVIRTIDGYSVMVMYTWHTGKPAIEVTVLFDPRYLDGFFTGDDINQFEKRNRDKRWWSARTFSWARNSISHSLEYNFSPPSYRKVIASAEAIIEILIREGLRPIGRDKSEEILPDLINEIEKGKGKNVSIK